MCVELLQDIGQWLGVGIANLAAALDPSCFVIGGGVSAADDLLIGPARDAFRRHLTGRGYRPEARIAKAQLGPEAGMVGAADLARLVARRFRRANRRRVERYERYERCRPADDRHRPPPCTTDQPPDGRRAPRPPPVRRVTDALIILLLIGVPAGYLVISAEQSRDSGQDKEPEYRRHRPDQCLPLQGPAAHLQVPVPAAPPGHYYETNNWKTSSLYVQFRTNEWGLEHYLAAVGTSTAALKKDQKTIPPGQANKVGWDLTADGPWSGTTTTDRAPHPNQRIMVNYDEPGHPVVYTVSTVKF